ncbi:hypothetical protein DW079_13715, partial [Segatella copri]
IFLHISTNRRTFATEIKQIVIEIFERLAKSQISKEISVFIFLHISTNRRTFATEIKQIVIEIFERLAKSQISKEIRHER